MRTICKEIRNERAVGNIYTQKSNIWKYLLFFNIFQHIQWGWRENFLWHKRVRVINFSKKCVKNEKRFSPYPAFLLHTRSICVTKCHVMQFRISLHFSPFIPYRKSVSVFRSIDKFPIVQIFNISTAKMGQ